MLFESGSASRGTIEQFFLKEQIAPKVVTETENVEIIKELVKIGMGVSIIPVSSRRARGTRRSALLRPHRRSTTRARDRVGTPSCEPDSAPVQEMMRTFDRVRQRLKLAPSTFTRASVRATTDALLCSVRLQPDQARRLHYSIVVGPHPPTCQRSLCSRRWLVAASRLHWHGCTPCASRMTDPCATRIDSIS